MGKKEQGKEMLVYMWREYKGKAKFPYSYEYDMKLCKEWLSGELSYSLADTYSIS